MNELKFTFKLHCIGGNFNYFLFDVFLKTEDKEERTKYKSRTFDIAEKDRVFSESITNIMNTITL